MSNCANYLRNLYRTYGTYKNKGFLMLPFVFFATCPCTLHFGVAPIGNTMSQTCSCVHLSAARHIISDLLYRAHACSSAARHMISDLLYRAHVCLLFRRLAMQVPVMS